MSEIKIASQRKYQFQKQRLQHTSQMTRSQSSDHQFKNEINTQQLSKYNSFVALKKLKQKNDELDTMKRRISKLKIQQNKIIDKALNNQRKIKYHSKVQESALQDRFQKDYYYKKMQDKIKKDRQSFNDQRYGRKNSIINVRSSLQQLKHLQYKQVKRTSQSIEQNLKNYRDQDSLNKRQKKQQISNFEAEQKRNVAKFNIMKKLSALSQKQKIVQQSERKVQSNQRQIKQLAKLEMQMIEKQSKSRSVLLNSSKQVEKVFGSRVNPEQRISSRHKSRQNVTKIKYEKQKKLPGINFKSRN